MFFSSSLFQLKLFSVSLFLPHLNVFSHHFSFLFLSPLDYDTFTNHLSALLLSTISLLPLTIFIITLLLLTALISSLLLSLPHGPTPTCPPMHQATNQTQTPQGIGQHLDCICQSLMPHQLLFSDLKLTL